MVRCALLVLLLSGVTVAEDKPGTEKPPRSHDPRVKIELFAENPRIVTPTGIDVDHLGRVWAVESNTHFPPAGYKGHPTDRVWVMTDTDGDGKCDKSVMFLDGLSFTMSVAVRPLWMSIPATGPIPQQPETVVYLATRYAIWECKDTNNDQVCDEKKAIVQLETKGNYPHNGLAGIAFDRLGWMYFGCGENLGADYKLVGSDGKSHSGGGEGGNIYRCSADGKDLTHWATGFWNPHASCIDKYGRLFTVDNDADSRPPCRLLHIIQGGDYGYRYRNGRKGLHPFTSWNGEIPGTLPMVAGTGEAPSGVLAYESEGLPADYSGNLLVTSWGDHRIDRFQLQLSGFSSFKSVSEAFISGGENFRPVGIACAPDGSLYCTDWVKRDYNLHGHGRVWKISPTTPSKKRLIDLWSLTTFEPAVLLTVTEEKRDARVSQMVRQLLARSEPKAGRSTTSSVQTPESPIRLFAVNTRWGLAEQDPFLFGSIIAELQTDKAEREAALASPVPLRRLGGLLATSHVAPKSVEVVRKFLDDKEPRIRRALVQWIAEAKLKEFRPQVAALLDDPQLSADLFLVTLAALEMLDGVSPADFDKTPPGKYVLPMAKDPKRPPLVRALALRMVPPTDPGLDAALLDGMLHSPVPELQREALRTLTMSPTPAASAKLRDLAVDAKAAPAFRMEAIDGLAMSAGAEEPGGPTRSALLQLLASADTSLQLSAIRSLRGITEDGTVEAALLRLAEGLKSAPADAAPTKELAGQLTLALGESAAKSDTLTGLKSESPASVEGWQLLLDKKPGDPVAGRRVFYHAQGAGCSKCHTVEGRGGRIGPDLSSIGRSLSREKLITSIITPSSEVAPQFTNWVIETQAGKTFTGMIVFENEGKTTLGMSDGQLLELPTIDIVERTAAKLSVMPEKLPEHLTGQEFRDLLAYLESLR